MHHRYQKTETPLTEAKPEEVKHEPVVQVESANVFTSDKFADLPINAKLKAVLEMNKYDTLTNIQKAAIPRILAANNVVLKSETGSGKTLTYLIPLIEHLHNYSINTELISRE